MCIDSGCPAKQLIYQFLYLKFLPTEDLKAWGTFGKLVIPAPYLWLSRFLFVPPFAEDEIMISVCSYQFFKILHLQAPGTSQLISLSHIHARAHVHALTHRHTHTHTHHFPMSLFIWSLFVMTWKPSTLGQTPSFKDKDSPSAATKKSPRVSQLHPNPLPVTGERCLEQSQVRKGVEHWEIKESSVDWGRGINQEILRSLWSLWLH